MTSPRLYGENPRGITDKMTRRRYPAYGGVAQREGGDPFHHDIWSNFQADPQEIRILWEMKRSSEVRLQAVYLAGRRQIYSAAG